jgi:hypothetical protein
MSLCAEARTCEDPRDQNDLSRPTDEDRILAWLARLPVGRPLTRHEAARLRQGEAFVASGGRGSSTDEVIAAAHRRLER